MLHKCLVPLFHTHFAHCHAAESDVEDDNKNGRNSSETMTLRKEGNDDKNSAATHQ